ncbi:MAG: LD-carboxypeptidase [Desulfamplus sp.]|nr:LD-carboxypeptidase [Desulfamplus sp.]
MKRFKKYREHQPLKKGDTLGICAPSGAFDRDIFIQGANCLEDMGFKLLIPPEIYEKKRYLAGNDILRAQIIHTLFDNPSVKGILCARGGFGSLRLLGLLDYDLIALNPKPFVGFSDITALLCAMSARSSLQVFHGPVVTSLARASAETLHSMYGQLTSIPMAASCCETETCFFQCHEITAPSGTVLRPGKAVGFLAGGNLATLCHLTGTAFQPDFRNSILFIEDVGEPPYKIDRMLSHMKLAGVLDGISGVVAGSFENCGNEYLIHEILLDIFEFPHIPVMTGFPAGHGPVNHTMRLGAVVLMDTEEKKLTWLPREYDPMGQHFEK